MQREAAEKLIYARICKNSVLYENRFWKDENFSMVSDATSHFYFHSTQNQAGKEGILTSYAIGEKADVLASQSDERRMKIITNDLKDFDEDAPKLAKRHRVVCVAERQIHRRSICALSSRSMVRHSPDSAKTARQSFIRRRTSRRLAGLYGRRNRNRRSGRGKFDKIIYKPRNTQKTRKKSEKIYWIFFAFFVCFAV